MRRALWATVLVVLGLLLVVVTAPAARAAATAVPTVDVCQGNAPEPENPLANGPLSTALPEPKTIPKQGDPWNPEDNTTILEQYGSAGPVWNTYDTGCGVGTEIMPNLSSWIANFLTLGPRFFTALTASIANWVLSPGEWLPVLDKPVDNASSALAGSFAGPLLPVALAIVAVMLVWTAHKGRLGTAATALLFVMAGLTLFGLATHTPSKIAGQLDNVVAGTVAEVMGAGSAPAADRASMGARAIDPFWQAVAYDRWLEGEFGSATSPTAQKYGPQLFKAQAMTWAEAKRVQGDAAATKALTDAKKAEWAKVAQQIKDADPSAYQFLTGTKGSERMGTALISGVVALACLPFVLVALGMTAAGFIVLRFIASLLAVFAVIVIVFRGFARTLWQIVGAVLVNTVVFAAGAAAVVTLSGAVLKSDLNMILAILIVFIMSFICWMILRPFRTLTRMVSNPGSGLQGALDAPKDAVNAVKRFGSKVAATYTGVELADDDDKPDPQAAEVATHANRPENTEDYSPASAQTVIMRQGGEGEPAAVPPPAENTGTVPLRVVHPEVERQEPPAPAPAPEPTAPAEAEAGETVEEEAPLPPPPPPVPEGQQRIWDAQTKQLRLIPVTPDPEAAQPDGDGVQAQGEEEAVS